MALPLAGLLLTAASAAVVVAALKLRFKLAALSALFWLGMLMVLSRIVMPNPPPVTGTIGSASEATSRMNAARRAQYVVAASKRVADAAQEARSKGESVTAAMDAQVERERRFYFLHQRAMWSRATAAGRIDMEAAVHGGLLGWYARRDSRTTPECLRADHCNFYVSDPPDIGLPGVVHVGCRCVAGPPWPGGKLLPSRGTRFARAA
jgi:hypothetical protein